MSHSSLVPGVCNDCGNDCPHDRSRCGWCTEQHRDRRRLVRALEREERLIEDIPLPADPENRFGIRESQFAQAKETLRKQGVRSRIQTAWRKSA